MFVPDETEEIGIVESMSEGAFALIDCLGFKGIWQREGITPEAVLNKLHKVRDEALNGQWLEWYVSDVPTELKTLFLSDTTAISLKYKDSNTVHQNEHGYLVRWLGGIVCRVIQLFLDDAPHLVLRGCITYGRHISDGQSFLIGPAVDIAAEYMNVADGAFVWLHPSAKDKLNVGNQNLREVYMTGSNDDVLKEFRRRLRPERPSIVEKALSKHGIGIVLEPLRKYMLRAIEVPFIVDSYPMPLKFGQVLDCSIVNPLHQYGDSQERVEKAIDMYTQAMNSDKLEVIIKKQNTLRCLNEISSITTQSIKDTHELWRAIEKLQN